MGSFRRSLREFSVIAVELREPVVVMTRERHKRKTREANSTNALHRDGQIRSSDEASVMGVERRGCVDRLYDVVN